MVRYYFDIKIYIREHLELELKSKLKLSNMYMYTLYHICTIYQGDKGQFTFVCFTEVAFKVPIMEGINDMVLYFSLNSCIIS